MAIVGGPLRMAKGFVQKPGSPTAYLDVLRPIIIGAYGCGRIFSPAIYSGACYRLLGGSDINFAPTGLVDIDAVNSAAGSAAAYVDRVYNQIGGTDYLTSAGSAPNAPRAKPSGTNNAILGWFFASGSTPFTVGNIWAGLSEGSGFAIINLNGNNPGWTRISDSGSQTLTQYLDGNNYDSFLSTTRVSVSNSGGNWASGATFQAIYVEQTGSAIITYANSGALASVAATFDNTPSNVMIPDVTSQSALAMEWIFFNRRLTTTERQLVEGAAAWRYRPGSTEPLANLPVTHPYKSQAPSRRAGPFALTSNAGAIAPMLRASASGGGGGGGGGSRRRQTRMVGGL